jgi:DNA polymerase-3 subunit gamma/tau
LLVRVALRQALPAYEGDDLYPSALLADLAARITPEDVQLYYQTAILGRRDLAWAPDARSGFEMTLLRMLAFRPGPVASTAAPAAPVAATAGAGPAAAGAGAAAVAGGGAKARPVVARSTLDDWSATLAQLEIGGAVRQLASHCAYAGRDGAVVRLSLDPAQQTLRTTALVEKLAQALTRHLGETVKVEIGIAQSEPDTPARAQDRDAEARLAAARRSLEEDPTVRAFRDKFGATIKPDSIRPT